MRQLILAALLASCFSCCSVTSAEPNLSKELAIQMARSFLVRHGYTNEEHSKLLPVEPVDALDFVWLAEDDEKQIQQLLKLRFNTIEAEPYCAMRKDDSYYVIFRSAEIEIEKDEEPDCPAYVEVSDTGSIVLLHSCPERRVSRDCERL